MPHSSTGFSDSSPAEASAIRPQLPALAGLRFYAAMHIVLLHTFRAGWLPPEAARLVRWGASSASLFFILSGFILTYAYAVRGGGMRVPARPFWRRRLARLAPPALVCHLLAAPLVWTSYGPVERWLRAAATAGGVQAFWPPFANSFNSPAWALSYLALGYLLLPAVLRRTAGWGPRRLVVAMGALWAAMLLPAAAYVVVAPADPLWRTALFTFPLVRLPEFLFGVMLARLFCAREWPRPAAWAAPAAAALLAASLVLTPAVLFPLNHNGLFAPLHAALLWALAAGTGGWMHRVLASRPSRRLGEASLGIYLLHVPVYAWMLHFFPDLAAWGPAPSAVFYAAFLGVTVALGLGLERALERLVGRERRPAPVPVPVPAVLRADIAAPPVQPQAS
ncbi:MAG TPA: acyltransferase [Longimicrobium sp.]|nr:acyltransferase [Longimicrobium sp.]